MANRAARSIHNGDADTPVSYHQFFSVDCVSAFADPPEFDLEFSWVSDGVGREPLQSLADNPVGKGFGLEGQDGLGTAAAMERAAGADTEIQLHAAIAAHFVDANAKGAGQHVNVDGLPVRERGASQLQADTSSEGAVSTSFFLNAL